MKKIFKKTLSLMLCVAFSGMQMSLATVLTTGTNDAGVSFAGRQVLTGATISGHTSGLSGVTTNAGLTKATLDFNKNTRIDWSKLNVQKLEELHFNNGSYGVINNVLSGMSTFAGTVTTGAGTVIISNPNGMLIKGGSFSGGPLMLTTKDMTNIGATDASIASFDFANAKTTIEGLSNGADFASISIIEGSSISAPSINIIANGVEVNASTLAASGANGVIFVTADGANYVAESSKFASNNSAKDGELQVMASSAIKAEGANGTITLVANGRHQTTKTDGSTDTTGGSIYVKDSTFTTGAGGSTNITGDYVNVRGKSTVNGDLTVTDDYNYSDRARGIVISGSGSNKVVVNGDLTINGKDTVNISNTTVNGTTDAFSEFANINLYRDVFNGYSHFKTNRYYVSTQGEVTVNDDMLIEAPEVTLGYYYSSSKLDPSYLNVSGDLTVNATNAIGFSDAITATNIIMTSAESSIISAYSDLGNGSLTANGGNITLTANKGEIISLDGNVPTSGKSDYYNKLNTNMGVLTPDQLVSGLKSAKSGVELNTTSGDVTVSAKNIASVTGLKTDAVDGINGNLTVDAGSVKVAGKVNGNVNTIDNHYDNDRALGTVILNADIAGDLNVDSRDSVNISNTTVGGKTDAFSEYANINLYKDTFNDDVTLNTNRYYVSTQGQVTVNGDMTINAPEVTLGYYYSSSKLDPSYLNVSGDLTVNAKNAIGYSDVITAANIKMTSEESSIISAYSDLGNGTLTTNGGQITLTANKGEIVSLNGNVPTSGKSDYYNKLNTNGGVLTSEQLADVADSKTGVIVSGTNGGSATLQAKGLAYAKGQDLDGDLTVTSISGDSAVTGTVKGNVIATGTQNVTATDLTAGNVTLAANDGKITVNNVTAVSSNATNKSTGNINATAVNGNIELKNVNSDSDTVAKAARGTITVSADVTADKEGNGLGDVVLSAKQLAGENFTTTNSTIAIKGANVDVSQTTASDSMIASNITAVGKDEMNSGNVTIVIPNSKNVDIADIHATNNITILHDEDLRTHRYDVLFDSVKLNDIKADSDKSGRGDINLRAKGLIDATDIAGANITLTSTNGNVKVNGAETYRGANDTDKSYGNIVVTADNGKVTLGNITAATDIVGKSANGTVEVVANLAADAESVLSIPGVTADNGIGDVIIDAKTLAGANFTTTNSTVAIKGANVEVSQKDAADNLKMSNLTAVGLDDNNGNVTIKVPESKYVDIADIHATHDITLLNKANQTVADRDNVLFESAELNNVKADSEKNGRGDINLRAKGLITADNISGANITLTSTEGSVKVTNAETYRAADDADKSYGNITLTADNGTVTLGNINAATDIIGTSANGVVSVIGNLTADSEDSLFAAASGVSSNGIGDVILSAKTLAGDNFTTSNSNIAIKGANVDLTQTTAQDKLTMSNVTADGKSNPNAGDVDINVPVKEVDLTNIHATKDITVNNGTADGILDSAKLTTVIADSEENGIGDLNIKTKGLIKAEDIGGANITLESTEGNIEVTGARSARGNQSDAAAGNIKLIAKSDDATISVGGISADTDVYVDASNGAINQTGDIKADSVDRNGVGKVTLVAKNGLDVGGDKGVIQGGDIELRVSTGDIIASNLIADGQSYDANGNVIGNSDDHGNISIVTPNGNVTIGTADKAVSGTHDVTISTYNGTATVTNTSADSEKNGQGTLTIFATGDVDATKVDGGNVYIDSVTGNVNANDVTAHAPNDDTNGDVIITANGNVTAEKINGDHDVVITAGENAKVTDAHADTDNNKAGDLIISGKTADVSKGTGDNVDIHADGDITADNIFGNDDVTIISDNGKVDANTVIADANNPNTVDSDGIGTLTISGKDDVTVTNGKGADVDIDSTNGNVDAENIVAQVPDDSTGHGNITIDAPNGDITVDGASATKDVILTVGDGDVIWNNVVADADGNDVGEFVINQNGTRINPWNDTNAAQEGMKNLLNLIQNGIDTQIAQSFTPIAFAADDEDEDSAVLKRIVKTVFKTPETGIVTITDRFKSMK